MHILLAPDSFKESLSAAQVAAALEKGFAQALPQATFDRLPLGDGGEGTMAALAAALGLAEDWHEVTGPFGQPFSMKYYRAGSLALCEMADLVGLGNIPQAQRNPLELQTQGLGELIRHLVQAGVRRLLIGVGGSASNDGGIGMAAGLGYKFYDQDGHLLRPVGASLGRVARISAEGVPASLRELDLEILTDVTNPLCGPTGATRTFGAQKGLSPLLFAAVDQAMADFYQLAGRQLIQQSRAGAGGGMAAGLAAFAGGRLVSGIDSSLDLLDFDQRVEKADLVVVGEGRLDAQSLAGKAPVGVARRTPEQIPVIAICGSLGQDLPALPQAHIEAAFSIVPGAVSLEQALAQTEENLVRTARNIGNLLKIKM